MILYVDVLRSICFIIRVCNFSGRHPKQIFCPADMRRNQHFFNTHGSVPNCVVVISLQHQGEIATVLVDIAHSQTFHSKKLSLPCFNLRHYKMAYFHTAEGFAMQLFFLLSAPRFCMGVKTHHSICAQLTSW